MKIAALTIVLVLTAMAVVGFAAVARWQRTSVSLVARLVRSGASQPVEFARDDRASIPSPVARYLSQALPEGASPIRVARLTSRGEFRMSSSASSWRPFRAEQVFATARAGFVWDARIRMAPGVDAYVRDALVEGQGSTRASLLGVATLVNVSGTPELAAGALHRYLGEALWFPTALLPGKGIAWSAIDDSTARVTASDGPTSVSLDFHFGSDGWPTRLETAGRYRDDHGRAVPTPWRVRVGRYEARGGFRIPITAEVEWLLPDGPLPYWRGEILTAEYESDVAERGAR